MKKEELFLAFDAVSEERLEATELQARRKSSRILLRCLIAAAIILLLALSALAAYTALTPSYKGGYYGSEYGVEDIWLPDIYKIDLNIDVPLHAPSTNETDYIPKVLAENWVLRYGDFEESVNAFRWESQDASNQAIFRQTPAKDYNGPMTIVAFSGEKIEQKILYHDGMDIYCIRHIMPEQSQEHNNGDILKETLYWYDGTYIFSISFFSEMSEEEILEIVSSLEVIDDPSPYILEYEKTQVEESQTEEPQTEEPQTEEPQTEEPQTEKVEFTREPTSEITQYYLPTYLPGHYARRRIEAPYSDTLHANFSGDFYIDFNQYSYDTNYAYYIAWDYGAEKEPRENIEINGVEVSIFDEETYYCVLWEVDGYDFSLTVSKSTECDTVAEIKQIVASVKPVDDITPYLEYFAPN